MRAFLSPAEQAMLATLTGQERETVRFLMDELDAHLIEPESVLRRTIFATSRRKGDRF